MGVQDDLNSFYNIDNLITVKIDLPTWDELRNAEPRGLEGYIGKRYDWHKATSVTVSGSKFPKQPATFNDVGAIKKSYWGSVSKDKPSMKIDFARFDKATGKAIEKLIGTTRLTLNNCKQDPGYFRQPLVYELFRQAGVPYFRCNFVKVFVNDKDMGLYVNLEPFREPYLKNNFGNSKGNAYEIDFGGDFNAKIPESGRVILEGFSDYEDSKDIILAADVIGREGLAGAKKVLDWEAFMRFWAMEILVKHRDGYTCHQNNSFAYNDVKAVENPTEADLKFKLLPSGVDLTLSADPKFYMGTRSVLSKLVSKDEAAVAELKAQIKKYNETVFSPSNYSATIEPFVNRLLDQMKAAGIQFDDTIKKEVDIVTASLKGAGSSGALNPTPKE